jgi:predicted ATPase
MRLDWLRLEKFKNLVDASIDFDEDELTTVLIGANGSGKSNVIEALVTIFRDLDLEETTSFRYHISYTCYGNQIEINNNLGKRGISIKVNQKVKSRADFFSEKTKYLPAHVFGYYSGSSRRLEFLFDKHQVKYYKRVISPESKTEDIHDVELRRLFYCRQSYGQLALLSYFAFGAHSAKTFLKRQFQITGFNSALLVLRKPRWANATPTEHQRTHGDPRFWYSSGLVRALLDKLWEFSLAPISGTSREQDDYRTKPGGEDQVYIFIKNQEDLKQIAESFGDEKSFFSLLETLDISDLIRDVKIWVDKDKVNGEIPFHEISDGEKQLLSVLGLMRFTGREESLFLLDEPDTHLNPMWKWNYLNLINEVTSKNSESHIILTSHDPLTMGSLKASQVQVMSISDKDKTIVSPPRVDPRGLGFTNILTQIFGMPSTVDPDTQSKLDSRNALLRLEERSDAQERSLFEINKKLKGLGFLLEDREEEYLLFLRAFEDIKKDRFTVFSSEEIAARNEVAKKILAEITARRSEAK